MVFGRSSFSSSIELANLETANVNENSPNGTFIGLLNTDDPDAGDTHTYTLIDDAGGRFAINNNNQLIVADGSLLDFESDETHTIEVETTDSGGLSFTQTLTINVLNTYEALVPDFNLDGKRDLVWRNQVTGTNAVWYMDGNTRTGFDYLNSFSDTNWQIVGAGDANGDEKTDLYWRNQATGSNAVWYMDGTTRTDSDGLLSFNNPNWQVVGIGDADNDSLVDDLYWRNKATGVNLVWYMDGTTMTDSHYLRKVANLDWDIVSIGNYFLN